MDVITTLICSKIKTNEKLTASVLFQHDFDKIFAKLKNVSTNNKKACVKPILPENKFNFCGSDNL